MFVASPKAEPDRIDAWIADGVLGPCSRRVERDASRD
jgi:hypothetical protein